MTERSALSAPGDEVRKGYGLLELCNCRSIPFRFRARAWDAECDPAGLAAFRVLFGCVMLFAVTRFWLSGWIEELYLAPHFHFTYFGFDWVKPWPDALMYAHFALMGLCAFGVLMGAFTRVSAALFCLLFSYAELIDKATYLNHYYFVSLVSLLLVFVPSEAAFSIDARFRGKGRKSVRAWGYFALRAQLALVYFFAGLAKLNADWLFQGQPLYIWLQAHTDWPVVGRSFEHRATALAMSWFGAVYDLTIPFWLSWRRSRPFAYAVAVVFHVSIWLLFPIGVFSWVMLCATTIFFDPAWPRRFLAAQSSPTVASAAPLRAPGRALLVAYLVVQFLVPLRYVAYPGFVNWTEDGFRFAWRVMLIEKSGQLEYEVRYGEPEKRILVSPRKELTLLQYKMMSTQPDMILDYAHVLAERYRAHGRQNVRVFAHAHSALNGHRSQLLIRPDVDLAALPRSASTWRFVEPFDP